MEADDKKTRDVLTAEKNATAELKTLVQQAVNRERKPITIYIGNRQIDSVVDADNSHIRGDPKADIALIDNRGRDVGFISHKKAGGAKAFQQYGGILRRAGPKIYNNNIVTSFVRDLEEWTKKENDNNSFTSGNAVYRKIPNDPEGRELVALSVYGPEWSNGARYSRESVHCIGQGTPTLTRNVSNGTYTLNFTEKFHLATDLRWAFTGDYAAILAATYRSGRRVENSGFIVRNARPGIYPLQFVRNRSSVEI